MQTETADYTASICSRLKQVRVQVCGPRGQSHFANLLHLSPSTYNYYEKGRTPPVDVLDRASRISGAPLLWLIRAEPTDFHVSDLKKIAVETGVGSANGSEMTASHTVQGAEIGDRDIARVGLNSSVCR